MADIQTYFDLKTEARLAWKTTQAKGNVSMLRVAQRLGNQLRKKPRISQQTGLQGVNVYL